MKTGVLVSILVATTFILSPDAAAASIDDRNPDLRYSVLAERMLDGEVASIGHVVNGIVFFPLRTGNVVIEVEIGPKDFVGKSGYNLKVGEMVAVLGAPVRVEGQEILLAREVRTMRSLFVVRDRNGRPMWEINRPVEMDPEFSESTLCEMILP
jgi:hypothetical protein